MNGLRRLYFYERVINPVSFECVLKVTLAPHVYTAAELIALAPGVPWDYVMFLFNLDPVFNCPADTYPIELMHYLDV